MPDTGNFDPAKAVQGLRQAEEAEKQRALSWHNNILKLLRYADEQLEEMRNPVVSEFVVVEEWWTPESKQLSDKRELQADQRIIGSSSSPEYGLFGRLKRTRTRYSIATRHERQTHYYGSWLSLRNTYGLDSGDTKIKGLVKLRQPRAGYADVEITNDWDPRNVSNFIMELTDYAGKEKTGGSRGIGRIHESLEETIFIHTYASYDHQIKQLTESVKRALDFVATGQPPEPEKIPHYYDFN